jgi:hypothetical protein
MTNSEVRKLLSDFGFIGRDLLSQVVAKAAEAIRPTDKQLAGVDQAASQDGFVSKGAKKVGTDETPVLEARRPGTDQVMSHDPNQLQAQVSTNGQSRNVDEAHGEQKDKISDAKESVRGQEDVVKK